MMNEAVVGVFYFGQVLLRPEGRGTQRGGEAEGEGRGPEKWGPRA